MCNGKVFAWDIPGPRSGQIFLRRVSAKLRNGQTTVSRVLFRKRELTEFCGKLGQFCEKLGPKPGCEKLGTNPGSSQGQPECLFAETRSSLTSIGSPEIFDGE